LQSNDIWLFKARLTTPGGSSKNFKLKVNTSASLVGATTIAFYSTTATAVQFSRQFWFNNTLANITSWNPATSQSNDELLALPTPTVTVFNFSASFYLLFEIDLGAAIDTYTINNYFSSIIRSSLL
jgi:hypothetical protein